MARSSLATGCCSASKREGVLFDAGAHRHDLLMVGDHLLGQNKVSLQQGLSCPQYRHPRQPTHLAQLYGECR